MCVERPIKIDKLIKIFHWLLWSKCCCHKAEAGGQLTFVLFWHLAFLLLKTNHLPSLICTLSVLCVIFREGFHTRVRNHPILCSHNKRDFQVMLGFEPFIVNSSNLIFDVNNILQLCFYYFSVVSHDPSLLLWGLHFWQRHCQHFPRCSSPKLDQTHKTSLTQTLNRTFKILCRMQILIFGIHKDLEENVNAKTTIFEELWRIAFLALR